MNDDFNLEEYGNYRVIEAMQLLVEDLEDITDIFLKQNSRIQTVVMQQVIKLIESKYIEGFETK